MWKRAERFLSLDVTALKQHEYIYVGQLFAVVLVNCGFGPRCLKPIFFGSRVKGPSEVVAPVTPVYDRELRVGLQQLMTAGPIEEANETITKKLDSISERAGS